MERFISVIIPNYNRAGLISLCIEAVSKSSYGKFEIIVVDDGSKDDSTTVIRRYKDQCRLIELYKNKGVVVARNTGAKEAKGEILLFTDSDVCLKENTLALVNQTFDKVPDISAVVGLPDKHCIFSNLASQHFNLRVHYNYIRLPDFITTLYTTISAVKKEAFFDVGGFNLNLKQAAVEDPELGLRLSEKGYKIYFNRNVSVLHHKHITFWALLRNDAMRTGARVELMIERKMLKGIVQDKRYITTPFSQILSALLAPIIMLTIAGMTFSLTFTSGASILLMLFWKLNFGYLSFVKREKGLWLSFKLYWLLLVDMFVVGVVLLWSLPKYAVRRRIRCR